MGEVGAVCSLKKLGVNPRFLGSEPPSTYLSKNSDSPSKDRLAALEQTSRSSGGNRGWNRGTQDLMGPNTAQHAGHFSEVVAVICYSPFMAEYYCDML